MLEFQITTDLEALPHELSFNFDELKAELTAQLERYQGLVITEDAIKEGKEDRAKLNKLKTALDTQRKTIKKKWNEPYDVFERKIKEVIALVDKPIAAIDSQLNAYEEQRKAEKREQIEDLYHQTVPSDIKGLIPLDRIFDQTWLNAGTSLKKVEEAISGLVARIQNDLLALREIEPEHAVAVRQEYYRTLDLGAAMRQLTALRETAEAMKRAAQAQTQAEPPKPAEPAPEPQSEPVKQATQNQPQSEPEKLYKLRLEFSLTKQQAAALKQFIVANGIEYKTI